MNCEVSNDYLMEHFDGEMNDIAEAQFKQHLKNCRKCSEDFSCMSEVFNSLKTMDMVEPPADFEAKVMEKVDKIELTRKEKDARMLVILYNAATVVSMILLMVFVADLKLVSIFDAIERISGYLGSFSSVAAAVFGVLGDICRLISGVLGVLFQIAVSIVKSYYYVFITLLALLFAVQKLFTFVAAQDRRETL